MRRFFRGIWLVLTTDCERSARLTSDSCDRQLTISERLAICVHNAFCRKSRNLARQLRILDTAIPRWADQISHDEAPVHLSAAAKSRIAQKLREVN